MVLPYDFFARDSEQLDGALRDEIRPEFPADREPESAQKLMPQVSRTCVADIFFSQDNVDALQHGVRYGVYKASGGRYVVAEQSRDELAVVMRSVYLEHSRNLPFVLLEQVRELNERVLEYCVPQIAREAAMYQKYRFDRESPLRPLEYGAYTSGAGLRGRT